MPPVSAPVRSMCGPRRLTRLARIFLPVGPPFGPRPDLDRRRSGGAARGGPGRWRHGRGGGLGGDSRRGPDPDLLIAVGNVEITRGQNRLLTDRLEVNRDMVRRWPGATWSSTTGADRLVGERIDHALKTGTGVVCKAVSAPYYHLSAERMTDLGAYDLVLLLTAHAEFDPQRHRRARRAPPRGPSLTGPAERS